MFGELLACVRVRVGGRARGRRVGEGWVGTPPIQPLDTAGYCCLSRLTNHTLDGGLPRLGGITVVHLTGLPVRPHTCPLAYLPAHLPVHQQPTCQPTCQPGYLPAHQPACPLVYIYLLISIDKLVYMCIIVYVYMYIYMYLDAYV